MSLSESQSQNSYSQSILESEPLKTCGHPNARQTSNTMAGLLCIRCLCQQITSSCKVSTRKDDMEDIIDSFSPVLTLNTTTVDDLSGYVDSLTNSNNDLFLLSRAIRFLVQTIDSDTLEYLVHTFTRKVKNELSLSTILCLEAIIQDGKCLELVLAKHGDFLVDLVFKSHVPRKVLPPLYRILKACCASSNGAPLPHNYKHSKAAAKTGYDLLFPHTLKIATNLIEVLRDISDDNLVFCCLDFLEKFFEHKSAVFMTFHSDITHPLTSCFRHILTSKKPLLQKAGIRILIAVLNAASSSTAERQGSQHWEEIPAMLIAADLDHHACYCLDSNDAELINSTIQLFQILTTKDVFDSERAVPVLECCLRAFNLKMNILGVDKAYINNFLSTSFSNMGNLDFGIQHLIAKLCVDIVRCDGWFPRDILIYVKLLLYCKDARTNDSLLRILEFISKTEGTSLGSLKKFLIVSRALLDNEARDSNAATEDSLERRLLKSLMDPQYLAPIFGLLRSRTNEYEDDISYVYTILHLLANFQTQDLMIPEANLLARIESVIDDENATSFEVRVPNKSVASEWTSEIFFEIAILVRTQESLMMHSEISSAWAQLMARLLQHGSMTYFPECSRMCRAENKNGTGRIWSITNWISGLNHLPLNVSKWSDLLSDCSSYPLGGSSEHYPKFYIVLASLFVYHLYAPNARRDFLLTHKFFLDLEFFLSQVSTMTQISNQICLYLKISIYLIGCSWFDALTHPKVIAILDRIMKNLELVFAQHSKQIDVHRILVFKWQSIALLTCMPGLPNSLLLEVYEVWILNYSEEFQLYLEICHSHATSRFKMHSLMSILLYTIKEGQSKASASILNLWQENQMHSKLAVLKFERNLVYQALFALVFDIRRMSTSIGSRGDEPSLCFDSGEKCLDLDRKLGNLSNILEVVDLEKPQEDGLSFPTDFFPTLINITRTYHNVQKIGHLGLEFLLSCLKDYNSECSVGVAILNDILFLKFLEKALHFSKSPPEQCFAAYEMMACLQDALTSNRFSCPKTSRVEWSLTCFISHMKYALIDVDYMRFLVTLLWCDFKSDLVQVSEVNGTRISAKFGNFLRNVTFNLGNLVFQIIDENKVNYVWITLSEILKYLHRCNQSEDGPVPVENINCLRDFIFSAPLLLMIETYVFQKREPETVTDTVLEFIRNWIQVIVETVLLPDSETGLNAVPKVLRPFRLQLVISKILSWIEEFSVDNSATKRRSSLLESIRTEISYFLGFSVESTPPEREDIVSDEEWSNPNLM